MKEETIQILKKYSQDHILNYLPKLTKDEQDKLEEQVLRINFEQLQQLYDSTKQKPYMEEKKIEHISYTDKEKLSEERKK